MENPRTYGTPPFSVAVIHGGPGACGDMMPVAEELSKHAGIIEPMQTLDTIDGLLKEMAQILENNAAVPLHLVGHSWGAWLSILFASIHPGMVKSLILVGTPPMEIGQSMTVNRTRTSRLSPDDRTRLEELGRMIDKNDDPNLILEMMNDLTGKTDFYSRISCVATVTDFNVLNFRKISAESLRLRSSGALLESCKKIKCPVVGIHGDHDPHPYAAIKSILKGIIKDFTFILLDKCGHYPWNEMYSKNRFFSIIHDLIV
ncbi:MAG: alpha/beta hydrolase [Spirochaetes bacterium]|jgi:pimeloyl-ACP methyl ester carboxylesterase|nr:alpha/beta hydrolase [Spirochaetota bacterium]